MWLCVWLRVWLRVSAWMFLSVSGRCNCCVFVCPSAREGLCNTCVYSCGRMTDYLNV